MIDSKEGMQPVELSHFRLMVALVSMLPWTSVVWTSVASQTFLPAEDTGSGEEQASYCSRTNDLELSHRLRKEAIKHEILLRLGLDKPPPNPDPRRELPTSDPVVLENYRAAQEVKKAYNSEEKPCTKLDTRERKMVSFFPSSVAGYPPDVNAALQELTQKDRDGKYPDLDSAGVIYNEHYRLKFSIDLADVTSVTNVIDYLQAELRLLKLQQSTQVIDHRRSQGIIEDRVEIRLIERPDYYLNQELLIFITHQNLKPGNGYAVFNVSKAIREWVKRRNGLSGEMELEVLIRYPTSATYGSIFEPGIQFSLDKRASQLVMTVYDEEGKEKRAAITAAISVNNPELCQFHCCWRPLVVNFRRDYNWTWIIRPETIEFNYCSGACPQNWALHGHHVRFLGIHRQRVLDENPTAAPEPCCVPDSYQKELFIINTGNTSEVVWIDDAIVTSCVCR